MLSEYQSESQTYRLFRYLRQHPGMVLSSSYALLTLCGILYSASFYREFDIAILKLANVSDLLIAGLSEPAAILMFCGGLLVAVSFDLLSQFNNRVQAKWRERPKSVKRALILGLVYTPKRSEHVMLLVISVFIIYAYIFVSAFAEWHSQRIKQGGGDKIMVVSGVLGTDATQLTLLGSTTNFLLAYNPDDQQVTILHVENIDKLHPVFAEPEK